MAHSSGLKSLVAVALQHRSQSADAPRRLRAAILATGLLLLCSGCTGAVQSSHGHDGGARPSEATGWRSATTTYEDSKILVKKLSYLSDGLVIYGQVCRPKGEGPFPVLVYNHGGFGGLGTFWGNKACKDAARKGLVTIASSYRGEDGSAGRVEVCAGEVRDVLKLIEIAMALAYTDDDRFAMYGGSHGGCITLRAIAAGAPVQAAASLAAPVDLASAYRFLAAQSENPAVAPPLRASYRRLVTVVSSAIGGTPDEVPEAYRARSPLAVAATLAAWPHPLLLSHGVDDRIVRVQASCRLAAAMGNVTAYRLDASGKGFVDRGPPGCEAIDQWLPGPYPAPAWSDPPYLALHDAAGHGAGKRWVAMLFEAVFFNLQNLPKPKEGVGPKP